MIINGTELSMYRGDTENITVEIDGVVLDTGDTIYFTVKKSIYTNVKSLQKVITTFTNGKALISLDPADTDELEYGTYAYDIQWTKADNSVITLLQSNITLLGEVTWAEPVDE